MSTARRGPLISSPNTLKALTARAERQAVACRFTLLPDEAQAMLRHEHVPASYLLDLYTPALTDTSMLTRGQEILDLLYQRLASGGGDERELFFMKLFGIFQMNIKVDALPAFLFSADIANLPASHGTHPPLVEQHLPEAVLRSVVLWLTKKTPYYPLEISMIARSWLHVCEVADIRVPRMPR